MGLGDSGPSSRAQEELYFHRIERELIERIRRRTEESVRLLRLSESAGVVDREILDELSRLGYNHDTVMLLHLAPLVHVAWADGSVSAAERQLIIDTARARGVVEGSAADARLAGWLASRPSAAELEKTMHVIAAMLEARSTAEGAAAKQDLVSCCLAIAEASGGILGLGRVSADEKRLLEQIAKTFEESRQPAVQRTLIAMTATAT